MHRDELIVHAQALDLDTDAGRWQLGVLITDWRVTAPDRSLATFVELAGELGVDPEELNHWQVAVRVFADPATRVEGATIADHFELVLQRLERGLPVVECDCAHR